MVRDIITMRREKEKAGRGSMAKLSIVVPVYNEAAVIGHLLREAESHRDRIMELVIVDDGSTDETLSTLRRASERSVLSVKILSLLNNCGKDKAVREGLRYAEGDLVGVIDADLQCSFSELFNMADRLEQRGLDVVIGLKENYNTIWNVLFRVFSKATLIRELSSNISDFMVARRSIISTAMRRYGDGHIFSLKGVAFDMSRKTEFVRVAIARRENGASKMSLKKLADVFTATFLLAFPNLARISFAWSIIFGAAAFMYGARIVYTKLVYGAPAGFPSLMIVQLIGFTFVFLFMGILGEYLNALMKQLIVKKPFVHLNGYFTNRGEFAPEPMASDPADAPAKLPVPASGFCVWMSGQTSRQRRDMAELLRRKLWGPGIAITVVDDATFASEYGDCSSPCIEPAMVLAGHVISHGGLVVCAMADGWPPDRRVAEHVDTDNVVEVVLDTAETETPGERLAPASSSRWVRSKRPGCKLYIDLDAVDIERATDRVVDALTQRGFLEGRVLA